MSRFTKAAAIEEIQARANSRQQAEKFDLCNGTSQLWPRGADAKTKAMVDRAVSYGFMMALYSVVQEIDSGNLGVYGK